MTPDAYHAFTRALLERITADPRELASLVPEWPAAAVETLRALLEPPRG